jgi:CDP-2,3-bis-(O-geranylgeranyl)-sn-glycerol synthase
VTPGAVAQVLLLVAVANGAPILATRVLGSRLSCPVDGGARLSDGRPLLGRSKTLRGLFASVVATVVAARILGLTAASGAAIAALAMAGDLLSSFVKRRIALAPSAQALGVDQVPESLLPALYAAFALSLSAGDVVAVVGLFFVGELFLSRLLYALGLREQPY